MLGAAVVVGSRASRGLFLEVQVLDVVAIAVFVGRGAPPPATPISRKGGVPPPHESAPFIISTLSGHARCSFSPRFMIPHSKSKPFVTHRVVVVVPLAVVRFHIREFAINTYACV